MDLPLFDEVADIFRNIVPVDLGDVHHRAHRYGIKVWFGPATPTREHYEAQVISPDAVAGATVLALEVGFHAEHPDVAENDAVLARLLADERRWRRALGDEPTAGPFLGRADRWRRISETWPDPDLSDPRLGMELATRLVDYVSVLEPPRRARAG